MKAASMDISAWITARVGGTLSDLHHGSEGTRSFSFHLKAQFKIFVCLNTGFLHRYGVIKFTTIHRQYFPSQSDDGFSKGTRDG